LHHVREKLAEFGVPQCSSTQSNHDNLESSHKNSDSLYCEKILQFEMKHPIIPIYTDIQKNEAPIQGELCTTTIQGHTPMSRTQERKMKT
jgi:hypothetical protein